MKRMYLRCLSRSALMEKFGLLDAMVLYFGANQRVEDGEDVPAVFEHARENITKLGFALGFAMPLGQNSGRNLDILAQFVRGMPPQEQSVEKCRFPLRILQIHSDFGRQISRYGRHRENAVYRKSFPRQVELGPRCVRLVNIPVRSGYDPGPLDRIQSA